MKITLVVIILSFTTFVLSENYKTTCGDLCEDVNIRHYHDIDKKFVKKKKRKKEYEVVS